VGKSHKTEAFLGEGVVRMKGKHGSRGKVEALFHRDEDWGRRWFGKAQRREVPEGGPIGKEVPTPKQSPSRERAKTCVKSPRGGLKGCASKKIKQKGKQTPEIQAPIAAE